MRIATYNVEWFDALFARDGRLLEDGEWSRRHNVTRGDQLGALGLVFTALDADAVMIVEAPDQSRHRDSEAMLETFAAHYGIRARKAEVGFGNDTQQEIALLYDPDILTVRFDPIGPVTGPEGRRDAPRFDGVFRYDLDVDASPELIRWSKPPLELAIDVVGGGALRMIGVHAKSKAPHGAKTQGEIIRTSIENRRKQLAQCIWLRQRIDGHLDTGDPLIVLGDLNDGPGLDEYERLFGRSGVEIVLGEGDRKLIDPHADAGLRGRFGAVPTSARFFNRDSGRYLSVLLDYVMVSPDLAPRASDWRIWHPFDDPVCFRSPQLREALLTASDHFPVSVELADLP
ncbi:MAG: endonuclease/exonuclease/phosphatase family protein [Pseudomonadota bacterium]